jgi:hypothetical protein
MEITYRGYEIVCYYTVSGNYRAYIQGMPDYQYWAYRSEWAVEKVKDMIDKIEEAKQI